MDRRRFLITGSAVVAATGITSIALGQDSRTRDISAPGVRQMTSVQGPYRLRLQTDTTESIGQIRRASGAMRRDLAARSVRQLPNADAFLAARFQASRNLTNRQWLQQSARTLFDNQRAQTAFMNWFPTLNDQAPSRPLTNLLLNGGDGFAGPTLMAYAAVGAAAGYSWQDIVDTLAQTTSNRITLTKDDNVDLAGELVASMQRRNRNLVVHLSQATGRNLRRQRKLAWSPFRKRGFFGGLLKVLTGAAAGAALGTLATGGVPGPGTVAGGVAGGLIGLGAAVESDWGGGSNGFWNPDGNCPPEDQPHVLC